MIVEISFTIESFDYDVITVEDCCEYGHTHLLVFIAGHVDDGHAHVDAHGERQHQCEEQHHALDVPHAQHRLCGK